MPVPDTNEKQTVREFIIHLLSEIDDTEPLADDKSLVTSGRLSSLRVERGRTWSVPFPRPVPVPQAMPWRAIRGGRYQGVYQVTSISAEIFPCDAPLCG